jgi:hypothetical protein
MAVAVRGCPQRSGRSRPGRGPSAALVDASLDHRPPCLQSRFVGDCHLRRRRAAQVAAAVVLSVVVRCGPFRTAVNGTLVARPARMTSVPGGAVGSQPDRRERSVRADHCVVGKPRTRRGSWRSCWRAEPNDRPSGTVLASNAPMRGSSGWAMPGSPGCPRHPAEGCKWRRSSSAPIPHCAPGARGRTPGR